MWECSVMSSGGAFKKKYPMDRWILHHHHGLVHKASSAWQTCSSSSGSFPLFFSFSVCFAGFHSQQSSCSSQHHLLPPSSQKLHFDSHWPGLTTASLCKPSFMQVAVPTYIVCCKQVLSGIIAWGLASLNPSEPVHSGSIQSCVLPDCRTSGC